MTNLVGHTGTKDLEVVAACQAWEVHRVPSVPRGVAHLPIQRRSRAGLDAAWHI